MWKVIARMSTQDARCSVILTTHSMEEAEALCTRIGISKLPLSAPFPLLYISFRNSGERKVTLLRVITTLEASIRQWIRSEHQDSISIRRIDAQSIEDNSRTNCDWHSCTTC